MTASMSVAQQSTQVRGSLLRFAGLQHLCLHQVTAFLPLQHPLLLM